MPLSGLTSRQAVLDAIAEFERLGRDAFLATYNFGKAREYFIRIGKRHYDSKAIAGVAFGYQYPRRGPLKSSEFSGGERTVKMRLEELGFTVKP